MYLVKQFHTIPPGYGGVSVYVKRLMLALCKRNIMSGAFYNNEKIGIPQKYKSLLHVFPSHSRSIFIIPELLQLLRVFSDYKIIHAHTSLSTCFCIWISHKIQNKPIVYTVHNQMIDKEVSFMNILDRYCLSSLARDRKVQFIAVNENCKKKLMKIGLSFYNEIQVIPAYIPPVEIGVASDYLSQGLLDYIKGPSEILLFYAESFATLNGIDIYGTQTIINLFCRLKSEHPKLKMVFCLSNLRNENDKLNNLMEQIKNFGFEKDVFWHIGALSEMWPLLKVSTVLIRPTITDGDSIMVREALAYGLPVIASNVTKRPEGCIVYNHCDDTELFDRTLALLNNPYRKEYPQKDYTDEIVKIYNRLLHL